MRAESTTLNESVKSASLQEAETAKDSSSLTVEQIEAVLFWEELTSLIKSQPTITEEDACVKMLVNDIIHFQLKPVDANVSFFSYGKGGIDPEKVDVDRITYKFKGVIDLYNQAHVLQLKLTPDVFGDGPSVRVRPTNRDYLENPITCVGQLAHLEFKGNRGVVYWESSKNSGSGQYGIASKNNSCIPNDLIVEITGVSYLDIYGDDILLSDYKNTQEIELMDEHMLHISANGVDLGWVYRTDLSRIN